MNVGRSVKMAMAKRDMKPKDLAEKLGTTRQYVSQLMSEEHRGLQTVSRLCEIFDMKVSEFLALGE